MANPYRWGDPPPAAVQHMHRRAADRREAAVNRVWLAARRTHVTSSTSAVLGAPESNRTAPGGSPDTQKSEPMP